MPPFIPEYYKNKSISYMVLHHILRSLYLKLPNLIIDINEYLSTDKSIVFNVYNISNYYEPVSKLDDFESLIDYSDYICITPFYDKEECIHEYEILYNEHVTEKDIENLYVLFKMESYL